MIYTNFISKKKLFFQMHLNINSNKPQKGIENQNKNNFDFSSNKIIFSRRMFLNGIFFTSIFKNDFFSINLKNDEIDKIFSYFEVNSKENNLTFINKKKKEISNFLQKEKDFSIIEQFLNIFFTFFITGTLVSIGILFSERSSHKTELPEIYSPNQISEYFKLRPEKIFIRFTQIFFEIFKFSIGLLKDSFISSEMDNLKYNSNIEQIIVYFFKIFLKNFENGLIKILDSFKILRIIQIYQIFEFRARQKKKKLNEIKWNNRAKKLRETIVGLSPAFIKLAQALITRPDIVSENVAKELQRLQDDMPFFSNKTAFNFIKKEIGANPEQIFTEISQEPVAAASLGQVYKGNLDGIKVAIKVQRPGLQEVIALDIFLIRLAAFLFQKLFRIRTDLVAIVDEYAQRLFEELDYRKESINMIKFRALYGYMDMICIPKVFVEYSSKHVLVMEWIDGERFVKNSIKSMQQEVSLIEIGVRCLLVQLLETGFLHCDPHGGNLIKTKDGRLAYLDFGLVSEIPETIRYSFISAILNLINKEYESLAKNFNRMSLIRNDDLDKEIENLNQAFLETFDDSLYNINSFTFQGITEKIFRLTFKFPFFLPPYFLNNLRAIATLEGLALMADPQFKIADVIYPYIINKLLTNPAPQFQAVLEDFLIDRNNMKPNWMRLEALLQDPEWTKTFSDESKNMSDTILNFIISPTGYFLKNLILQNLLENFYKKLKTFIICIYSKKFLIIEFSKKKIKNNKIKENSILTNSTKSVEEIIFLNFKGSKIYSFKIFYKLVETSFVSTLILLSEFFFKIFYLFFCMFFNKFKSFIQFSNFESK
jgi:predicted unusual protein kinase regulating ubiquinone biosynthesis (AarF/ABC1/UbiB family)